MKTPVPWDTILSKRFHHIKSLIYIYIFFQLLKCVVNMSVAREDRSHLKWNAIYTGSCTHHMCQSRRNGLEWIHNTTKPEWHESAVCLKTSGTENAEQEQQVWQQTTVQRRLILLTVLQVTTLAECIDAGQLWIWSIREHSAPWKWITYRGCVSLLV